MLVFILALAGAGDAPPPAGLKPESIMEKNAERWETCILEKAVSWATTREPVDAVADAAIGACRTLGKSTADAMVLVMKDLDMSDPTVKAHKWLESRTIVMRSIATAEVMRVRYPPSR